MKQSDWFLTIAGVLVLLWVFSTPNVGPSPSPPDKDQFPKPVGVFAEVPDASKYLSGDSAGDLAWFWRNFAVQFKEDEQITNTAMARNMHVHAGKALRRLLGEKVYSPEFATEIEAFFDKVVGMDNKNIDSATRDKIYQAFMAVAWSCNEAADSSLLSSTGKKDNSQCFSGGCSVNGCLVDELELVNFINQIDPKGPGKFFQIGDNTVRGPPQEDLTQGLIFDEKEVQEFIQQIPDFKEFGFEGSWEGKERLLYRSLKKFDPGAYESERQTTGDCKIAWRNNMNLYGTKVKMADGTQKPIEDVVPGELVLNAHNEPSVVKSVFKKPYSGDILEIRLQGHPYPVNCTPDHLLLTSIGGVEKWVRAEDLTTKHSILVPFGNSLEEEISLDLAGLPSAYLDIPERNVKPEMDCIRVKGGRNSIKRHVTIDSDLAWVLGIYLAEGGLRYENNRLMGVDFSLNRAQPELSDKICRVIKEKFNFEPTIYEWEKKPTVRIVRLNSMLLAEFFDLMCPGKIDTKHVNHNLLRAPKSVQTALVNGWFAGDGHFYRSKRSAMACSISRNLIDDMFELSLQNRAYSCFGMRVGKPGNGVKSRRDSYTLNLYGKNAQTMFGDRIVLSSKSRELAITEYGFERKVLGVTKRSFENIEVYCIEVPNHNSFVANGFGTHNCTSHATRNACDTVRAFEIDVLRESEDFVARGATEAIYGARGHAGQGMSIVAAVKFVSENGGVALRRKYDQVDLSVYNAETGISWGRNKDGTPSDFRSLLQNNQVTKVSHISSVKDAADAIYSGFALTVGSGYSFSNTRDQYGIAKRTPQGWAHAMAWVAVTSAKDLMSPEGLEQYLRGEYAVAEEDGLVADFPRAEDDPCFLIVNSWGTWNNGPKGKYDIPEGSFWITADNAAGMIKQQQAFALGNFEGFAHQNLDDWGFTPWLGTKNINYEIVEPSTYQLAP